MRICSIAVLIAALITSSAAAQTEPKTGPEAVIVTAAGKAAAEALKKLCLDLDAGLKAANIALEKSVPAFPGAHYALQRALVRKHWYDHRCWEVLKR